MKQAILAKPGSIEIRDTPVPAPAEGELVVKINTSLTCGTDLKAYKRGHTLIPMPGPFGHEYSGTVAAAGRGVSDYKEGDPVMGVHSAPCNECRYCRKGLFNLCEVIMEKKALGAFAEYMLVPSHVVQQNLFQKPVNVSFEEAALLEPFACVLHPYNKKIFNPSSPPFEKGGTGGFFDEIENALVMGAGPIGLLHLAYLKMHGIRTIVSDISESRLSAAEKMEGTVSESDDLESVIQKNTDTLGVDLVVECTGQPDVWEKTVHYIRRGGTAVLFGGCPAGTSVNYDTHRLHYDELTVSGSFHYTPDDVRLAHQILTEKKIDLSALISGAFPLEKLADAFELLEKGEGIKYAIKPEH
jgi:L-iditol 2-dehydrogenase